jgi:hypothetical protein
MRESKQRGPLSLAGVESWMPVVVGECSLESCEVARMDVRDGDRGREGKSRGYLAKGRRVWSAALETELRHTAEHASTMSDR